MNIDVYALCWNDGPQLHFFFRHYDPFVTRYVIFDDGSDPSTLEILRRHPRVEIRRFDRSVRESFVLSEMVLSNECWKESRGKADWVIVTDIDEHLWHPDIAGYLARCRSEGVTAIPALGFQMISDAFPDTSVTLSEAVTMGMPWWEMMKLSIFDPRQIAEINFTPGRHSARPVGRVRFPAEDQLLLLHYKYLGFSETLARHRAERGGLGALDLRQGWGIQYTRSAEEHEAAWRAVKAGAVDYRTFAPPSGLRFPVGRWWRAPAGV